MNFKSYGSIKGISYILISHTVGADFIDAPLGSCLGDNIIRRPGKMGRTDKRETYVNMNMLMREQDFTDLQTFR